MQINKPVPLERHFSVVPRSDDASDKQEILPAFLNPAVKIWSEIDKGYRSVILAEAGAGKTFEMLARAKRVAEQGHPAFFIRIEDIDAQFEQAFEVGSAESFDRWLGSLSEGWFYLDSVDEARLSNPRGFEKAIRRFSVKIKDARLRAHICISSRPYAWRPQSDRDLIERHLPFAKRRSEPASENMELINPAEPPDSALNVYWLRPLDESQIRRFAVHRSAPDVDRLIYELKQSNLLDLAGRPFDLEGMLAKWTADRTLGGRRELLRHSIETRLRELDPDRAGRQPLSLDRTHKGARLLAAAVMLTGEHSIQVPDKTHKRIGIVAEAVLTDWSPRNVQTLLEGAVFDNAIYGAVRFRHRDVRELLAAEWFIELLQNGNARHAIESLIFRQQYGQEIISPRLRAILPWLILDDEQIRKRALALHPEIAVEGGDPALIPLPDRKNILANIVKHIVRDEYDGFTHDNSAITRIAQPDLTETTLALINRHADHDAAIFFLGKLAWQGNMTDCVPPLLGIAANPARGIYARNAAARALMACGTTEQKHKLWNFLLMADAELPSQLLAELVRGAAADVTSIPLILESIRKLPPYDHIKTIGLRHALRGYIERIPHPTKSSSMQPLAMLFGGLGNMLERPPYIDRRECRISRKFSWLMSLATHALERLVSARSEAAMQSTAISIMLKNPATRSWREPDFDDYEDKLGGLVPGWPELNDALFWQTIKAKRMQLEERGKELSDVSHVQVIGHYWDFGPQTLPRVLEWVKKRRLEDDRFVALSLAFQLYAKLEKPVEWREQFQAAVTGDAGLETRLDELLNPTVSEEYLKWQKLNSEYRQKREQKERELQQSRSDWIAQLRAKPDLVCNPPGLKPGKISDVQWWLLTEARRSGRQTNHCRGAAWKSLIHEFGSDVAFAYREAAMRHWRHYKPGLSSEGADTSSIRPPLQFAMVGLEIEAREVNEFPKHLSNAEMRHALRYITRELIDFPSWLETMHRNHPYAVMDAIQTELFWELANAKPDQPMCQVLRNLAYYAPWLHRAIAEPLLAWVRENDLQSSKALRQILHILGGGGVEPAELAMVAQSKVRNGQPVERFADWYAIWVDTQPDTGVAALENWLAGLGPDESSRFAQLFIVALMGRLDERGIEPITGNFRTARHLKTLYLLMHEHIRAEEDINRNDGKIFEPELRDLAQDARHTLFRLLSEIPGKEAYIAITDLAKEHPDPGHRSWMAKQARRRAEQDGDIEPWTAEQVSQFSSQLTRTPSTHRQLFELTIDRLIDLKNWLERSDDSPWRTWQRAKSENEMRNLVAGWLKQNWGNTFTVAQEPELANNQRVDIWLQNQNVESPVSIELKVLDKNWTGPKLCERLRNQLAGDYLRQGTERCGVMLLVWQGHMLGRRWKIGGALVNVRQLQQALKDYWAGISNGFPNIAAVEVVVIDLTRRAIKSNQ